MCAASRKVLDPLFFQEKKYEEPGKDLNLHQTHIMVYLKMDGWTQVFPEREVNNLVRAAV